MVGFIPNILAHAHRTLPLLDVCTVLDLNVVLLDPALSQAVCRVVLGFLLVQLLPSSPFGLLYESCDVLDPNSCCIRAFLFRSAQLRDLVAYCFTSGLVGVDGVPELDCLSSRGSCYPFDLVESRR